MKSLTQVGRARRPSNRILTHNGVSRFRGSPLHGGPGQSEESAEL
jgi:hypothetical protein